MDAPSPPIDLTKAFPPAPPILDSALATTLSALSRERDLGAQIRLNRPAGTMEDRKTGSAWLSGRFGAAPPVNRILVTNGTQSALALILQFIAERGDLILAEQLTYAVLAQIVRRLGMRIEGVPLDDFGIVPEAFETLCRAHRPKALYCNPTVHNPTATVMPQSRRAEIAGIARRHGVAIVEDDVLGALHGASPAPIAVLAPDITWYCMSLSKCFGLGLRLAYVLAPSQAAAADLLRPVQNFSSWFPPSLSLMIVADWIHSGVGRKIAAAIHDEMTERQALAAPLLENVDYRTASGALHIWLRLPPAYNAQTFAHAALRAGVAIRPSSVFTVDESLAPNAVRVSLSTPVHRADLEAGLRRIAALVEHANVPC